MARTLRSIEGAVKRRAAAAAKSVGAELVLIESPGRVGVFDALIAWPGGVLHLVEFKVRTGRLSGQQERFRQRMVQLGVPQFVLWSVNDVNDYVKYYSLVYPAAVPGAR
jgi:hypothetical protein